MVITGNAVAEILGLILLPLCIFLDIFFVLEQPLSSLLFQWPTVQPHLELPGCFSVCVDISIFGCICEKQLSLRGTWPGLPMLKVIEIRLKAQLPDGYLELEKASKPSGRLGPIT